MARVRAAPGGLVTTLPDPSDAVDRVPGWSRGGTRIEGELPGLSNRSFLVASGGERFVLRLPATHTAAEPAGRSREIAVQESAAAAGIAPPVVFADPDILVTRLVAGRAATRADFADTGFVDELAVLLRRVHALPPAGHDFDAAASARRYRAALPAEPAIAGTADRCLRLIERVTSQLAGSSASLPRRCCCHNDVVGENLIVGEGVTLIDWEFAADNDPYFDLACPLAYHELGDAEARALLSAYAGAATSERRERLAATMRLYDALHWLWLARRQVLSPDAALADRLDALAERVGRY